MIGLGENPGGKPLDEGGGEPGGKGGKSSSPGGPPFKTPGEGLSVLSSFPWTVSESCTAPAGTNPEHKSIHIHTLALLS